MITIDEAAQKWSCSKNTVFSYIYKRYITGMCVDGETLLLPDIKKPYIPRKRLDGSLDYYKALLRTIQKEQFIDEHILGILASCPVRHAYRCAAGACQRRHGAEP